MVNLETADDGDAELPTRSDPIRSKGLPIRSLSQIESDRNPGSV